MMNLALFKLLQSVIKIEVAASSVIMFAHCILLLFGHNTVFAEWVCGYSLFGFSMLFIASYVLHFCNLFRCLLTYSFLVDQCILAQRSFQIFGDNLTEVRFAIVLIGMSLLTYLGINFKRYCLNE